ncbi:MAG: leucyl aminopeptidase [Alphaproteobacteria bacterium]|nr:leucyl aminopeptidase [Alphaproteobacteria bacterium]
MKVSFAPFAIPAKGLVVIPVLAGGKFLAHGSKINKKTGQTLSRAMTAHDFKAKAGDTLRVVAPHGMRVQAIVLVGLGEEKDISEKTLHKAGGAAAAALSGKLDDVALIAEGVKGMEVAQVASALAFGMMLRSYRFEKYFTKKDNKKPPLKALKILGAPPAAKNVWAEYHHLAEGVFLARDLVTEPPNHLYPANYAEQIEALAALGLKVQVLNEHDIQDLGMGALMGVAQGSAQPPRVVTLLWQGLKHTGEISHALVGKGVTFDTGGISLKPGQGMWDMKYDMAGSAAVVGAMRALAANKVSVNVVGAVGLVENMPSGHAMRPGDVVKTMSGQTVEVLNTDAEGRLVLADVLWYVQEKFKPACMIDLATLTGAMVVALGNEHAGLFTNNDELAQHLSAAGMATEEKVWRFPLHEAYDKLLESECADMKNISTDGGAGSITAAQFLQRFIKKGVHWAHLDIAGMAWARKARATTPMGASGYGVQLLYRYVCDRKA